MARPSSSVVRSIVTFSGMVGFIGILSAAPRISIVRDEDSTSIKYRHVKQAPSTPAPSDPGLVIAPSPKRIVPDKNSPQRPRPFSDNDWIFDTGATTHVCTNRALLHSYSSYAHTRHSAAVGHFGPNPVPIIGIGDCTLDLPGPSSSSPSVGVAQALQGSNRTFANISISNTLGLNTVSQSAPSSITTNSSPSPQLRARLTLSNIAHIPSAGLNIISWSQLKRSRLDLGLVENTDGSLAVVMHQRVADVQIMRFVLQDGLYFLDRGDGGYSQDRDRNAESPK